jgi:hypothetical protein
MKKNLIQSIILKTIVIMTMLFSCDSRQNTNQVIRFEGEYVCISLGRYFQEISRFLQTEGSIPPDFNNLFGMSWLDGYVIDKANNDIILVGRIIKDRPHYHTEDLIVNFQNVFDSAFAPYCSLDPYPENILRFNECFSISGSDYEAIITNCREAIGEQQVVIGGVPRNSRHAKIMIYADYDMKKLSQGLIKDAGVRSSIDFAVLNAEESGSEKSNGNTMSRFWFHIKESKKGYYYPNYIENDGIVFINECPVVVLTEIQVADASGNLQDDLQSENINAEQFAEEFSKEFVNLTKKFTVFAELENMFRLQACLRAMRSKKAMEQSKVDLKAVWGFSLNPETGHLPESLPGLVNYRIIEKVTETDNSILTEQRFFLVAGGVSQEMTVKESNFHFTAAVKETSEVIVKSRPEKESVKWIAEFVGRD